MQGIALKQSQRRRPTRRAGRRRFPCVCASQPHAPTCAYRKGDLWKSINALGQLSRTYDLLNRLIEQRDAHSQPTSFSYDANGNQTGIEDALGIQAEQAFDPLDRLRLTARRQGGALHEGFTYDATGNRLSKIDDGGSQPYTYPSDSHRLSSVGIQTRSHDAMGNLTAKGNRTFAYDADQRLKQFQVNGQTEATYTHNGRGERTIKQADGQTWYFIYDEQGRLLAEYRTGTQFLPQLHRLYVWLDDRPVAVQPKAGSYVNEWLHVHTDHLGTPRAITLPKQGNLTIWRWSLQDSAFGEHAPDQDPDGDTDSFTFNLRYPGQYFDAESGLHYNYFRDYEPGTGRYIQSDPIGLEGGVNTFLYSAASPLIYFDSLGLMRQCSKGGKKNVGTEGFNKNSDPKEVERALKDAKRSGQKNRAAALRALLKVIKRGGHMSVIIDPPLIIKERCLQGGILSCVNYCSMAPWDEDCKSCDDCEA